MSARRHDVRRADRGSVLPMVLVLVVIGALVVVPLLDYAVAVFRSNRVVSDRTAQAEAAKGGLRVALDDPKNVFLTCDGGGNLTPSPNPPINGISVTTTCTEELEVGPAIALGFEVPTGAAAMQLGATVPVGVDGGSASSPAVPPYPTTPDWWASPAYTTGGPTDPAQYSPYAEDGKIWMPDLPRVPPTVRTSTPFDMPGAFNCKVFFPGRYSDPVVLSERIYFASGVYYFEDSVTVSPGADVVVGYGLEDFGASSDCADDLQVAANVLTPPATFDIDGGGATFVFGVDGQLVIENTSGPGSGPRIRFNQRYADADRGGRVSIMTVNGDDVLDADHTVTDVNIIPRSEVLRIEEDGTETRTPISSSAYAPSSETFTDKARLPQRIDNLSGIAYQEAGTDPNRGVVSIQWDEVTGQGTGGALLGEKDSFGTWIVAPYKVQYRPDSGGSWIDACFPDELVIREKPVPTDGNVITCSIDGIPLDVDYRYRVKAENEVGLSPQWRRINLEVESSSPLVTPPDAPTGVQALPGVADDVAQITWAEPASDGGAPITDYQVDAYQTEHVRHANAAPVTPTTDEHIDIESHPAQIRTQNIHVRAFDPNGDDLTLAIDTSLLPPGVTAVGNDADDSIQVDTAPLAPVGTFDIPYTVTDPLGAVAAGLMRVEVVPVGGILPHDPVAEQLDLLANVDEPIRERLPYNDSDGTTASSITLVTGGFGADWTINLIGDDVEIRTTAPDGVYSIPYTVTDPSGRSASSTIEVTVDARRETLVNSCSVTTDPLFPTQRACEISLPDLTPGTLTEGNQGYRFDVAAINEVGASLPGSNPAPLPFAFDGGGVGLLPPPVRVVEPWIPEPVIDIDVDGGTSVEVAVAGYVAVPMGRVHVDNPNGYDVKINGGVMTGTFEINDSRDTGVAGSLPIGFKNDIVLQRKVKIVSRAGGVTSTAVVEVNEDGAGYAVNHWIVG